MDFLREQRRGGLHDEVTRKLHELVCAVMDHRKAGSLTIKITIKPGDRSAEHVEVADQVTLNAPEADRPSSIFFTTPEGNLSRRDPRQGDLEEHLRAMRGGRRSCSRGGSANRNVGGSGRDGRRDDVR